MATTNVHQFQEFGGEPFANIKADAFCEILGQEIDRVRNESITQVAEMRKQYEMELQALRQEFSLRETNKTEPSPREARDDKTSKHQLQSQQMPETVPTPLTSLQPRSNKTLDSA